MALETRAVVQSRGCWGWIRWFTKAVSLALSLAPAVGPYLFICWDLYKYAMQQTSGETCRESIFWLFFAQALLECCAMVALLTHEMLSSGCGITSAFSNVHENGGESHSAPPGQVGSTPSLKGSTKLTKCALFVVTSTYTTLLYAVYFSDARLTLPHITCHKRSFYVTFRQSFFSFCGRPSAQQRCRSICCGLISKRLRRYTVAGDTPQPLRFSFA